MHDKAADHDIPHACLLISPGVQESWPDTAGGSNWQLPVRRLRWSIAAHDSGVPCATTHACTPSQSLTAEREHIASLVQTSNPMLISTAKYNE